jgi:hypothetical protein
MTLTPEQVEYLNSQTLGRLATVDRYGAPQNNPVTFRYNPELGTIDGACAVWKSAGAPKHSPAPNRSGRGSRPN